MADGVSNIDEILQVADGIMVARGDLGVEIGNEKVPMVQKKLIAKARAIGKPVITATQMLMSMVQSPTPSRAEASDVANAVLDGSDALMLSNETATGLYPLEAVKTMASIIIGAETAADRHAGVASLLDMLQDGHKLPISEAIEAAATALASSLNATCLSCLTRSGQAARQLAKYRPGVPIYAFAENEKVQKQLSLSWGVFVIPWKEMAQQDYTVFDELLRELGRLGLVRSDDQAVMTAGIPTSLQVGTTNTVVVRRFETHRHGAGT
jgi:pyruvate kinase